MKDLISVQKNLKHLYLKQYVRSIEIDLESVIPLLTKHSDSLIKLELDDFYKPLSFIAKFTNLQELKFTSYYVDHRGYYKEFKDGKTDFSEEEIKQ